MLRKLVSFHAFGAILLLVLACKTLPEAQAQTFLDMIVQEAMRQQAIKEQQQAIQAQQQQQRAAEAARMNAIRQTWSALDPNVSVCVNRLLQVNGQSIEVLVKQGVMASDPGLTEYIRRCHAISSQQLVKGLSCVVEGVQTTCNDTFVFKSAPNSPLNPDQLATAVVANRTAEIVIAQIEPPEVRSQRLAAAEKQRREQMINAMLAKLAPLADPSNSFASKRAIPLQKSISAARGNPKVSSDQIQQWYAEVDRLVMDDREEKVRQQKLVAEKAARGEVDVKGTGAGPTKQAARLNAYWDIFLKQLRELVSTQADGDLGKTFRQMAEKEFDKFRADFFTSSTTDECKENKKAKTTQCDVTGTFKTLALKSEIQKVMSSTIASGTRNYRFILVYPEPENVKTDCGEQKAETSRFLINQVSSEFSRRGYTIVAKSAEEATIQKGEFDYFISILDINHCDAQDFNGNFITVTLRAQVKLLDKGADPSKRVELANVPVSNTKRSIRNPQTPIDAVKRELLPIQGTDLAGNIVKEIDAKLLTMAQNNTRSAGDVAGAVRAPTQYSIKIENLKQSDRAQIRLLRDVVKKKLGVDSVVDPKGTTDRSVEITFDFGEKFDTEDLIDLLYETFKDRKTFKVQYNGNRSFTGSY